MEHQQNSLFETELTTIDLVDGDLSYDPQWMGSEDADRLFSLLMQKVAWEQSTIRVYGKTIKIPRLNAWYGDPGCAYEYSGRVFQPEPWLNELLQIRNQLLKATGVDFNSVLINCYRDGNDSVSWHSDDEPELGRNPVVASVSLGAERIFQLRHKFNKKLATHSLNLASGSLLLMAGSMQHHWHHQIPKRRRVQKPRINLTFRQVKQTK